MRLNAMLVTRVLDSLSENEINDMVDLISEDILNANKVKQKKTRVNRLTRILRKPKQVGK
jgi:type III secretory pathway lipoprotein EscJ